MDSFDGNPEFFSNCEFLLHDPLGDLLSNSLLLFLGSALIVFWLMPLKNLLLKLITEKTGNSKRIVEKWEYLPLGMTALAGYFSINLFDDLLNLNLEQDLPLIVSIIPSGFNLFFGKKRQD